MSRSSLFLTPECHHFVLPVTTGYRSWKAKKNLHYRCESTRSAEFCGTNVRRGTSMGREANIESIRALEEQIEEGKGDIIKLKRTRNSLLNISVRIPPEVLGHIFILVVALTRDFSIHPGPHFSGLEKGSYNFLLVCHHWFEVASATPELWNFWGNAVEDWEKWHHHAGGAPVDLVLYGRGSGPESLSPPLRNALVSRTTQDQIRKIHLDSNNLVLLNAILSSLTPSGKSAQEKSIESLIFRAMGTLPEFSTFFTQLRLPRLQRLHIIGVLQTPLWENLRSQTTHLTSLSLQLTRPSRPPTISQMMSILGSNPNLRELTLSDAALPDDADESHVTQVPLLQLKTIALSGKFRRVFGVLRRLELPIALNCTKISLDDSTVEKDVTQILGSFMRDQLQRDTRFQDKLNVTSLCGYINVCVDNRLEHPSWLERLSPSTSFTISVIGPPDPVVKSLTLDLMGSLLHEHVIYLETDYTLGIGEEQFSVMPNIETLWLRNVSLVPGFLQPNPNGPHANTKLLPSLRSLHLENATGIGWRSLMAYLEHQTSNGQSISFELLGNCHRVPPKVVQEIRGLVRKFVHERILNSEGSDEDENEGC